MSKKKHIPADRSKFSMKLKKMDETPFTPPKGERSEPNHGKQRTRVSKSK